VEIRFQNERIEFLVYQRREIKWLIPVDSFCISDKFDKLNPGTIIKEYLNLNKKGKAIVAEFYLAYRLPMISEYINKLRIKREKKPDCIQIFKANDKYRDQLIEQFHTKIVGEMFPNETLPPYLSQWSKVNQQVNSNKIDDSADQNSPGFGHEKPNKAKPIQTLWLIDDTMNTGGAMEIFLNKLYDAKLLTQHTKIKAFFLYNDLRIEAAYKDLAIESLLRRLNS
jgi:hypothetical protein